MSQAFSTLWEDLDTDLNFGFKTGIDLNILDAEVGFSAHLLPDKGGPTAFHGKLARPLGENLPNLAIGIANTTVRSRDQDRAGDPFAYAVLSHDFEFLRVHGGLGFQDSEALPFIGVDRTFRMDGNDLFTLRGDAIQQSNSDWLFSAGVLIPITDHFVLETWGNFPERDLDPSITVKLNIVITF